MTDTRAELLRTLADLGERFPEFRLGQMVVGLAWAAREPDNAAIYDVEDEELLAEARALLAQHRDRGPVPTSASPSGDIGPSPPASTHEPATPKP